MRGGRLPQGTSDPVSFDCTCSASSSSTGGIILLFYRYYASPPTIPPQASDIEANTPVSLVSFHTNLTQKLSIGGKIRIATEGFNITVGGTAEAIDAYIQACILHWSFAGIDLSNETQVKDFFKPTVGGCACAFGGSPANVRMCAEITPMGVTDYLPAKWDGIQVLEPEDFHEACLEEKTVLMDVRNYYESRIGYFVSPVTGEAVRPGIRRFAQWPLYVRRVLGSQTDGEEKKILTYCTGGIRCEKGARFLQENVGENNEVCTLKGGIAAYLAWMDEEIKTGRKKSEDSLFKGRNYVFDARGSTGLDIAGGAVPVSRCHMCGMANDRLSKCRSVGCHIVLVICEDCEDGDPRCCKSCREMEIRVAQGEKANRGICDCEQEREEQLWGKEDKKILKAQGWRKERRKGSAVKGGIDIRVKVID